MKVQCKVSGYHPATRLDLVEGEMDVTPEAAAELEACGFLETSAPKKTRATKPEKEE
jgi:hypothetical protein